MNAQFRELLRLRTLVTWRTYTATATARLESYIFLPMTLGFALSLHSLTVIILREVLDPRAGFRALSVNLVMLMHVTLLFFWIGWLVVPALGFRTNEALDYSRLRLAPIRLGPLFAATVAGYALDLSTLIPLALSTAIVRFVAGVIPQTQMRPLTSADGLWLGVTGLEFLALLLLGSLAAVQVFMNLLPRVDFTKLFSLVFVAFLAYVLALNFQVVNYGDGATLFDERFIDRYNRLPTGAIALALHEIVQGNHALAARFALQALAWIALLLAFNWAMLSIVVEGKLFGLERIFNVERLPAFAITQTAFRRIPRWPRWVRTPELVIAWKDARSLLRDRYFYFFKTMPGIMAPTIILLAGNYNLDLLQEQYELANDFLPFYLALVVLLYVAQANLFCANLFGFERDQVPAILTAPVTRLAILHGKHAFLAAILTPDITLIASLSMMLLPHPSLGVWLVFVALLASVTTVLLALGSIASVLLPYFTPLDRPVITLQGAVLVGLANSAIMLALVVLMVPSVALLVGPVRWWGAGTYAWSLPLWLGYNALVYTGFTRWAAALMPDYEEWIYLRVRGVL